MNEKADGLHVQVSYVAQRSSLGKLTRLQVQMETFKAAPGEESPAESYATYDANGRKRPDMLDIEASPIEYKRPELE